MARRILTLGDFLSLGTSVGDLRSLLRQAPSGRPRSGALMQYRKKVRCILRNLGEQIEDFRPVVDDHPLFTSVHGKASDLLHELPRWIGTRDYTDAVEGQAEDEDDSLSGEEFGVLFVLESLYHELRGFASQHGSLAVHVLVIGAVARQLENDLGWCPMGDLGILPEGPSVLEMSQLEFPCQQPQPPDVDVPPSDSHESHPELPCHAPEEHLSMFRGYVLSKIAIKLMPEFVTTETYQTRTRKYVHGYHTWRKEVLDQWVRVLRDELGCRPISRIGQGASKGHLDEIRMTPDFSVHAKLHGMTKTVFGGDDTSRAAEVLKALCAIGDDSVDSSKLSAALGLEKHVKPGTLRQWALSIRKALQKTFGEDAACWTRVVCVKNVEELHVAVSIPPFYDGERCTGSGCGYRYTLNEVALPKCPKCSHPHKDYERSPRTRSLDKVSPLDTATTDPEPQD